DRNIDLHPSRPSAGVFNLRDMAARGLYKAADGSWRQADANTGIRLLYRLRDRERWTLLDCDRVMVIHPRSVGQSRVPGRARGGDRLKSRCLNSTKATKRHLSGC